MTMCINMGEFVKYNKNGIICWKENTQNMHKTNGLAVGPLGTGRGDPQEVGGGQGSRACP